jgi:membrane-associated protein
MDLLAQIWDALFPPTVEKFAALVAAMGPWFYVLLFVVVFCETGLVATPVLPGDSLLFAAGALTAGDNAPISLPLLIVLLIAAAVIGDSVNYAIGYHLGPKVFKYERSWFFNPKHLLKAQAFYDKYGSKTLILARFVPIVRTFAPFVAGISRMPYRRFIVYSVSGGVAWVLICTLSGYYLPYVCGLLFDDPHLVDRHFEIVIVAVVLISVMPMAIKFGLEWWRKRSGPPVEAPPANNVEHLVAKPAPAETAAR